ncbi:MAG: rod-binding protein [Planctomycetales bacterium]|nr:rod-binding protein [bacterium]UNM07613.1 MAG: rod-binding protein [Planctomycetales bacterium]
MNSVNAALVRPLDAGIPQAGRSMKLPAEDTSAPVQPPFAAMLQNALLETQMAMGIALHETPQQQAPPPHTAERIDKASSDMEALFVSHLLKEMWRTIPESTYGMKGTAGEIYRDMFIDNIAEVVSEGQGIGLKDVIRRELLQSEAGIMPKPPKIS